MSIQNVVIFARSNHGPDNTQQQVHWLREFALQRGFRVVSEIGLPHTSANDGTVEQTLTGLVAKPSEKDRNPAVLVTDLSRLSRDMVRGGHLLLRLQEAGWTVISAGGSDSRLDAALNALPKLLPKIEKKVVQHGNAKNRTAGNSADAEGDDRVRGPRVPRQHEHAPDRTR